ncbi:HD domain-containing phosphohydrolase [Vogesella oryzae]|uniref:HD domain-containing phosphohydrolase n=1 Tax=Vogesella oryzae TaxID=1735285 RepID=UPI00158260F6|nr:HD domain-containing phosphohydrolase [Vogesella oryzae]
MPAASKQPGSSLQLLLTLLISALVVLTALTVGFFYQRALQQQQLAAQNSLFRATAAQLASKIGEYGAQAMATTALIAQSGAAQTYSQQEREAYIGTLVSAMRIYPALQAVYLGYPNGDFFLVRRLDDAARRAFPHAGAAARWVVQLVSQQPDGQSLQSLRFLDDELQAASAPQARLLRYDPRERPWYRLADGQSQPVSTEPYRFATTGQAGITYAYQSPDDSAITGVDIRLPTLTAVMQQNRPSARSSMALLGAGQQLLLGSDLPENTLMPTELSKAPSPLLAALGRVWRKDQPPPAAFEWQGERWHVSLSDLLPGQHDSTSLLVLMPERDLFADGQHIAAQALWIPLLLLLLMLPLGWLLSRLLSKPIYRLVAAAERIRHMDFSDEPPPSSSVRELNELMAASEAMKGTIRDFIGLSRQIVAENALTPLLQMVLDAAMHALPAASGALWLVENGALQASHGVDRHGKTFTPAALDIRHPLLAGLQLGTAESLTLPSAHPDLPAALQALGGDEVQQLVLLPLQLESHQPLGLLVLGCDAAAANPGQAHRLNYLQALVSFAAIAIDNRRLAGELQQLMNGLVELVAGAIDAKSPYTGGHCQRVPAIAQALAEAAHQSEAAAFAGFRLDAAGREALYIASWLHDCGKVTTPEYVVDKATKLETIHDRIHEIRTRFEVLKRDADIRYWQGMAEGGDPQQLAALRDATQAQLDDDFAFVARCNQGGEFMRDEDLQRLRTVANLRWQRTLDDRLGLGPLELERLAAVPQPQLPVEERLLADKPEHLFHRPPQERLAADNPWGFTLRTPEWLYNKGELHNLTIRRGTLTEEERYKINEHIVETIRMLDALPFPSHLQNVPEIASGHHERMDGNGYPRGLTGAQMSIPARIMAIADVFEALTAADRPYKPAKPMSEALDIMQRMAAEGHLDPELFALFLDSGVWRDYGTRFLLPQQLDIQHYPPVRTAPAVT